MAKDRAGIKGTGNAVFWGGVVTENEIQNVDQNPKYAEDLAGWIGMVEEFVAESDRAAVILAAARLDELLYQLLQTVLLPSPNATDDLLDTERPLSTFSARIHMAYRLGLIDPLFTRALHLVRRIRNEFAHATIKGSLASGAQKDRVRELSVLWPGKLVEGFTGELRKTRFQNRSHTAVEFFAAVALLMADLDHLVREMPRIKAPTLKTQWGRLA